MKQIRKERSRTQVRSMNPRETNECFQSYLFELEKDDSCSLSEEETLLDEISEPPWNLEWCKCLNKLIEER